MPFPEMAAAGLENLLGKDFPLKPATRPGPVELKLGCDSLMEGQLTLSSANAACKH